MTNFHNALVIDDDFTNNLICENFLKRFKSFQQIICVLSVQEGLDYLQKHVSQTSYPDIIFLDLRFPDGQKDAWDFLQEYGDYIENNILPTQTPLYILTSSIGRKDASIVHDYEFIKGFISKPLTEEKISKILNN